MKLSDFRTLWKGPKKKKCENGPNEAFKKAYPRIFEHFIGFTF